MDIESLLSSLGEDDVRRLKETAAQFFGGNAENSEEKVKPDIGIDPAFIKSAAKLSSVMNMKDPRCELIVALKPLLSEHRQKKADDAVMLLRLFKMLSETGDITAK